MYDTQDDPDRLYYAQGLGGLDSDSDSGDNSSLDPGDHDDIWGDEEVSFNRRRGLSVIVVGSSISLRHGTVTGQPDRR